MSERRPTIDAVAAAAGVSKATVSAVINDKDVVTEATRQRVLAAMEQLNYRPAARAVLKGQPKRRSIVLLIKEMDNPYYTEIASGALAVGAEHGYTVLVASSEGSYETERQVVELLRDQDVDGLIITPVLDEHTDLSHLFELKRRNFPFVLLEEIRGVPASLIDVENVEASRRAVEYLIEGGHKRIVHFAGPEYSTHSRERIDGVRRAFSGSQLVFGDASIVKAGAHLEDGYRTALGYFADTQPGERPTAVTCYNDLVALGVCRALGELGLSVPGDVSVIGYDGLAVLDFFPVPLTTVHVPKHEMGEMAARVLIQHIEAREPLPPRKVYLDGRLVVRGSTRALGSGDPPPGDTLPVAPTDTPLTAG